MSTLRKNYVNNCFNETINSIRVMKVKKYESVFIGLLTLKTDMLPM